MRKEKKVRPRNSRTIEKMYSLLVCPEKSPYPTVVMTSKIQ
jgi:hypothetical protein